MFDLAALSQITANIAVSMYAVYHQDGDNPYVAEPWQSYVAYLIIAAIGLRS